MLHPIASRAAAAFLVLGLAACGTKGALVLPPAGATAPAPPVAKANAVDDSKTPRGPGQ